MKTIGSLQVTSSLEGGSARNFDGKLVVNDAFYLKNFKGISNLG